MTTGTDQMSEWLKNTWAAIPENRRATRGWQESPEHRRAEEEAEREARAAGEFKARQALRAAGVPEYFRTVLDRLAIEPPPQVARWAEGFEGKGTPWLWVTGGTGAGKTTAACWALREVAGRAGAAKFLTARELKAEWDGGSLFGEDSKHDRLAPYERCGLLVLDGLGEESTGTSFIDALFDLVDSRYNAMLPTVVTSQHGLKEYRDMLARADDKPSRAAAIASRVYGAMGGLRARG